MYTNHTTVRNFSWQIILLSVTQPARAPGEAAQSQGDWEKDGEEEDVYALAEQSAIAAAAMRGIVLVKVPVKTSPLPSK